MSHEFALNAWDLLALLLSVAGLVLGVRLAFQGRLARMRWRRIVEGIVAATLGSMIGLIAHLVFAPPPAPQLDAAIGSAVGVLAYLIAGGLKKELLGLLLGSLLFVLSYAGLSEVPGVDSLWVPGLGGFAAFLAGYKLVDAYYAHMMVFTTSFTGASWVATSLIGFFQVLRDQSLKHLLEQLLSFMLPAVAIALSMLGLANAMEALLMVSWIVLFLATLTAGLKAQMKDIRVSQESSSNSAIPIPRWGIVVFTFAYGALFVAVRVYGLGHSADAP